MPSTEPGGPSPRGALSKLRRYKHLAKGSTNSLTTTIGSGDVEGDDSERDSGGLRATLDAAVDKVKRRTSIDAGRRGSNDSGGGTKVLSALIPRRRKTGKNGQVDLERQLSGLSGDSGNGSSRIEGNRSDSSLLSASGHSDLLTDDEADVHGKPTRPTLSPHQSHAGLLTLSSPELAPKTQSVASAISSNNDADIPSPDVRPLDAADRSAASIPHIIEHGASDDTEPFPSVGLEAEAPISRSASPAERLKGAFNLPRKQKAEDTDSLKGGAGSGNGSGSGGLGGLFRPKSRRGSLASQRSEEPAAKPEKQAVPEPQVSVPELAQSESQSDSRSELPRPETAQNQQQTRGRGRINTDLLPVIPPNLVDTPTTLVTPPTPTLPNKDSAIFPSRQSSPVSNPSNPSAKPSPPPKLSSVESIRHRRTQSANLPSKLSNAMAAPLTPTVEEAKTPGGTLTQPANVTAAGFFSNFFNAAQKAADQLSNNVNQGTAHGKGKGAVKAGKPAQEQGTGVEDKATVEGQQKERAVDSLGKGDLSLSHLGIAESSQDVSLMNSSTDLPGSGLDGLSSTSMSSTTTLQNGDTSASRQAEENAAARAVSLAYEKPVQSVVSSATGRPLSIASDDRLTLTDDHTPPRSGTDFDSLKRSGSVRSKLSNRRRRHRTSSATTGTQATGTGSAIAAAIQSSATTLANPATGGQGHRLTGFAVASSKRNKEFHSLFRSVPEDDYLIEDYSAALQRDILLHGRLYVSEGHICFSSNILGWVNSLVISFDEVVSIEKKSTAVIFPNAIVIQTLQARNTFASFVARDSTYELLIGIWKISHPNLKSSLNGVTLDNAGTGDRTEVADAEDEEEDTGDGSDDEVYDEDEDDDVGSYDDVGGAASVAGSDIGDTTLSGKASPQQGSGGPLSPNGVQAKGPESAADVVVSGATASADFPGPATHSPTECSDAAEHYDKSLTDTVIPAPLGRVYSLLYGPASASFMRKWLVEDQKSRDLNLADDKVVLDNEHRCMTFDYIKPLHAPVGPKQTKCITTNTVISFDLERSVSIDCNTQTPDVPSGNAFVTRTRYCLMWGPGNGTRLVASDTVEWSGKSWLKGPIEKGAHDGQVEYVKSLVAALKAAVTTRPAAAVRKVGKGKRKGKKESEDVEAAAPVVVAEKQKPANWGLLEPLHQLLSPILAIVRPFVTSQTIIAVLFVLLIYSWMFPPYRGGPGVSFPGYTTPQRLAAYEELWRREEGELWEWLEDRAGLDHLHAPSAGQQDRQRVLAAKAMGRKLGDEKMSEVQMDDAIKITEERLSALKDAVARKKGKTGRTEKAKADS